MAATAQPPLQARRLTRRISRRSSISATFATDYRLRLSKGREQSCQNRGLRTENRKLISVIHDRSHAMHSICQHGLRQQGTYYLLLLLFFDALRASKKSNNP